MKKENRIKKNEEIAEIVGTRQRVYSEYIYIYYRIAEKTRVAISVSKKCGHAVVRNHIKRIVRSIMRTRLNMEVPVELVIVARPEIIQASYNQVELAIDKCLDIIKKKNQMKMEEK